MRRHHFKQHLEARKRRYVLPVMWGMSTVPLQLDLQYSNESEQKRLKKMIDSSLTTDWSLAWYLVLFSIILFSHLSTLNPMNSLCEGTQFCFAWCDSQSTQSVTPDSRTPTGEHNNQPRIDLAYSQCSVSVWPKEATKHLTWSYSRAGAGNYIAWVTWDCVR